MLSYTRTLLDAVHHSQRRSSDGWSKRLFLSGGRTAMRGIASKQGQEEIDSAIESLVLTPGATISMPLWGFSLDEKVALGYGTRFVFRLRGEFNAVPTWAYSRLRQDELELIGGGTYAVVDTQTEGDSLVVDLEQV